LSVSSVTVPVMSSRVQGLGLLDSYFPEARFFTDGAQFEDFLSHPGSRPDYFVVCTPNDLHAEHAALGLRVGADVILEKPPALSSHELDTLTALQGESGHAIHPVLQLRYHDALRRFRKLMEWRDAERPVKVSVTYITRRGPWFGVSWKGDPARSGTIIFNIGIHLLDGLTWAIGVAPEIIRAQAEPAGDHAEGRLQFGTVTVGAQRVRDVVAPPRRVRPPVGERARQPGALATIGGDHYIS
jgi:UDP-N-acetyl-2-amino-2-deoxyglucuronate dehydrogenase